jgi:hypothetical protein
MLLSLSVPMSVNGLAPNVVMPNQKQALVISPLDAMIPFGFVGSTLNTILKNAGYNVTSLADGAVQIDFLLANLNNYNIVIWRTNTYTERHVVYWYLGEHVNSYVQQKYSTDFAEGLLNAHAGILGMSPDFITQHFKAGSLNKVKLLIFLSSYGASMAPKFLTAGVSTVIFNNGIVSLQSGLLDQLTLSIVSNLLVGKMNVQAAVFNTLSPVNQGEEPQDPYDSTYAPPFWFTGDGTLVLN